MKFILRMLYALACGLWASWVLMTVWAWYIQPLTHMVLTFKQAVGVDLVVGLMTHQYIPRDMPVTEGEAAKRGWTHDDYFRFYLAIAPLMTLAWAALFRGVLP